MPYLPAQEGRALRAGRQRAGVIGRLVGHGRRAGVGGLQDKIPALPLGGDPFSLNRKAVRQQVFPQKLGVGHGLEHQPVGGVLQPGSRREDGRDGFAPHPRDHHIVRFLRRNGGQPIPHPDGDAVRPALPAPPCGGRLQPGRRAGRRRCRRGRPHAPPARPADGRDRCRCRPPGFPGAPGRPHRPAVHPA